MPEAPWTRSIVRPGKIESRPKTVTLVKVAPVKYQSQHFAEVDQLNVSGYTQKAALDEIAAKFSFNREGFEKQYRNRWLNRKKSIRS
jgi:hypothetical protein